jgi:hypothetical protein
MILPRDSGGFTSHLPTNASLDRINNEVGYRRNNVRFVSLIANLARQQFSDEDVFDFALEVAKRNRLKQLVELTNPASPPIGGLLGSLGADGPYGKL